MRSLLFVPGDSPKKLEKGLSSGADILLIDLEDSVALSAKPEARRVTAAFLAEQRATAVRPRCAGYKNDQVERGAANPPPT